MDAGRPTDYSEELAIEFCSLIALGNSLRKVVSMERMPSHTTVYTWFNKYPEFLAQYVRAKEDSAESDADRIEEIAEKVLTGEYEPQQGRVAMDAYKWTAGKKRPRKYGDKLITENTTKHEVTDMTDEQLDHKLQALINATSGTE